MIHANELMIGDLVQHRDEFNEVTGPYEIDLISNDEIAFKGETFARVFNNSIEPIPLTPEILEKNGFIRPNERVRYFTESTDYYDVAIHEITDSIWYFEYQNCEAHFPPCLILISHVHELQHALRLVGIEHEITL